MENLSNEIWKDIKEYEGLYQISNFGRVRNRNNKLLKIRYVGKKPYTPSACVILSKNSVAKTWILHRLLGMYFLECPPNYKELQINHIDGNRLNNKLSNLEWCTASENQKHAFKMGLQSNKGEKNSRAKLTQSDVDEIRAMVSQGVSSRFIASKFNTNQSYVRHIVTYKTWK